MDATELFNQYRADRVRLDIEGFAAQRFAHLVRYKALDPGTDGLVAFARLAPRKETAQIQAEIDYFRALGQNFEWKIYDFDCPPNLRGLLESRCFAEGDREFFMVLPLSGARVEIERNASFEIRRVQDDKGVRDVLEVQEQVWQQDLSWVGTQLMRRLRANPNGLSLHCAYDGNRPIGSGWTEFPTGSRFPELHGGAVLEPYRGRGVYLTLYRRRLAEVLRRTYSFVTVDASAMSQPILEKLGFQRICGTVPMTFKVRPHSVT